MTPKTNSHNSFSTHSTQRSNPQHTEREPRWQEVSFGSSLSQLQQRRLLLQQSLPFFCRNASFLICTAHHQAFLCQFQSNLSSSICLDQGRSLAF